MNTLIKNVPIARVGKVFDGREITLHMLERCRDTFCPQEYQPYVGELYTDWRQSPTVIHQGKVLSLRLDNDTLFADIEMFMSPQDVREKVLYPSWISENRAHHRTRIVRCHFRRKTGSRRRCRD
ncbi:hypothetical protein MZF08_003582 [Salmonella enterica]|nr:hypothetical protein [Salmonella enterica]ECP9941643.1 hypothetical protein [Salmonella enterica]EDD0668076.1 hypothetical protein [Salmonella enterica]EDW3555522.1 hypothetical protein [Salmonella enterica]EEG1021706.1 hypothetical protein [Salmonella enterica]